MKRPLPTLYGADWNEAVGTGNVTVEVPQKHLEAGVFEVAVGSRVFVVETEEDLGVEGVVLEILGPFERFERKYLAVVRITEN